MKKAETQDEMARAYVRQVWKPTTVSPVMLLYILRRAWLAGYRRAKRESKS